MDTSFLVIAAKAASYPVHLNQALDLDAERELELMDFCQRLIAERQAWAAFEIAVRQPQLADLPQAA